MGTGTIIVLIVLLLVLGLMFFVFNKKISELKPSNDDNSLLILQQQMNQMAQALDQKLSQANQLTKEQLKESVQFLQDFSRNSQSQTNEISRQSQQQVHQISSQSQQILKEITEKLIKLEETNKQVVDFSSQLKNLQDILKNPKQRGILGEYYLEETLKNVLPPNNYQMQYKFNNGEIVDAVIFVDKKIIPIDSKFSLENYEQLLNCNDNERRGALEKAFKQDLKNRIDETAKYVRPQEKTFDFAFMFIPSESIYYDLLVNKVGNTNISSRDLIEYAFKDKHVIIVSPTSFLAYLQTVLQGLRALEFEQNNTLIRQKVEQLGKHMVEYESYFSKMGNSLSTTVNHFNLAQKKLKLIDKDVYKITEKAEGGKLKELEPIEKPKFIIEAEDSAD